MLAALRWGVFGLVALLINLPVIVTLVTFSAISGTRWRSR